MRYSLFLPSAFLLTLLPTAAVQAQTTSPSIYVAPPEIIEKIKDEGLNHSQLMSTLTYLTETFGPRLTGSPNLKGANDWTRSVMAGRGMDAHLEAWGPFGRGWTLRKFSAQMNKPYVMPIVGYPKAWGPSTPGEITSELVYFDARTEDDFAKYKGKLKGKIVLTGTERPLKSIFEPMGVRKTDAQLDELAKAPDPGIAERARAAAIAAAATAPAAPVNPFNSSPPMPPAPAGTPGAPAGILGATGGPNRPPVRFNLTGARMNFLLKEGVALIIDNSSAGSTGNVFVAQASVAQDPPKPGTLPVRLQPYDKAAESKMVPQMTVSSEQWNRLHRLAIMGSKPILSVNIASQYHDKDPMAYNTVADVPGTDLKDQVIMLGGHMDSWQGGTGATDNGCDIAVAMEAARIIQTLPVKPRRTIRVALWTGEEEGLLGSAAYVKQHFGEMKAPDVKPGERPARPELQKLPEYEKLSAYFNLDNGAGKIRGIYAQGNTSAAPILAEWLKPFAAMGAGTMSLGNTGSTDHISFDRIGLPGFQFIQDDLDYWTQTHHSTADVLERVPEDDVKFNATILAAFVYQAAMMDDMMPRKPMN